MEPTSPKFFKTPTHFRRWLEKNHATSGELWVGYYKKGTGRPSITWPESVEQALCYGWIDGIRKKRDDLSYVVRFTPRREKSIWSTINLASVKRLRKAGLMTEAGLRAFERRKKVAVYSYEGGRKSLSAELEKEFKQNPNAWSFFDRQPPWYKRSAGHWVMDAKRQETIHRRLHELIRCSAREHWIKPLTRKTS